MRFGPLDNAKLATWIGIAAILFLLMIIAFASGEPLRLVVLHKADGRDVMINPAEVTSLREARSSDDPARSFTKGVECMISLSDGRFVTVAEDCDTARKLIEDSGSR